MAFNEQPEANQPMPGGGLMGPPGEESPSEGAEFSARVEAGGTNLEEEDMLLIAASIAYKQQQGLDLDKYEQGFVEQFFPGGVPPEFAEFSPEAKELREQQENEAMGMVPGGERPQPQMPGAIPEQPQAVGPPGA